MLSYFVDRAPTFHVDSIHSMGCLVCMFVKFLETKIQFILRIF